jgi:hypothetical protein
MSCRTPIGAATAFVLSAWALAACQSNPLDYVRGVVETRCLSGQGRARWNALSPELKEPTFAEFCKDEAHWAGTMYAIVRDPSSPPERKIKDREALRNTLGYDLP